MIPSVLGGVSLGIWLYLLVGRGGFWRVREPQPLPVADLPLKPVAIIVPARNEADLIGASIRSLLGQDYPGPFRIFLVDDESSDGTAEIARKAAEESQQSDRLTIVRAAPRPAGWTGKLWALSQGLQKATTFTPDYCLLTDADIVHHPGNLTQLVARAENGGFELVSLMVQLHCQSWAERSLIPAFVLFFFMLYPPAWVESEKRNTAAAAGGCILISRNALEGIGGIAAIRNQLIDDCALARAVKQKRGHIWLGVTRETRSARKYLGCKDVSQMISRSAFTQLNYSSLLLGVTCLGMMLTFVVPPPLVVFGGPAAIFGAGSWVLMSVIFLPTLRLYDRSPFWAPLLPLIALFYLAATIHSAIQYWTGRGGAWKGRVQAPRRLSAP